MNDNKPIKWTTYQQTTRLRIEPFEPPPADLSAALSRSMDRAVYAAMGIPVEMFESSESSTVSASTLAQMIHEQHVKLKGERMVQEFNLALQLMSLYRAQDAWAIVEAVRNPDTLDRIIELMKVGESVQSAVYIVLQIRPYWDWLRTWWYARAMRSRSLN